MLNKYVRPQVKQKGLTFQQDGASWHYAVIVREWLDKKFPNRLIGKHGPIEWSAHSPDLTPPDFYILGYQQDIVYKDRPSNCD